MSKGNTLLHHKRFWKLLILEIIVVGCVGGYFLVDSHDVYRWWVGDTQYVTAPSTCNLHEDTCTVRLANDLDLTFGINPKPIPLMKALEFRAYVSDIALPFIEINLFSTNMNMGFHTFKLYPKGDGLFVGEGMLPTCVVGNMLWQTNLIINTPQKSLGATFYFQTNK